jgi:hypothetical protein
MEWRVPLHPEDAEHHRKMRDQARYMAEDLESAMRRQDTDRLAVIAAAKYDAERAMRRGMYPGQQGREVDQEAAARYGIRLADRYGVDGRSPRLQALAGLSNATEWAESEPDSRNVFMQAMLIPENAILNTAEALSYGPDNQPRDSADMMSRLAWAIPSSVYPDLGYPIQPARDRMYKDLGPVAGTVADFTMPGLEVLPQARNALNAVRYGRGVQTELIDGAGEAIRRLRNSPRVRPEYPRLQYAP